MSDVRSGYGVPTLRVFSGWRGTPIYIDLEDGKMYCLRYNQVYQLAAGSGPGGASWGDIDGTLSDQTDLQAALDAKGTSNFSGAYNDLTGKPVLFDGAYSSLTGRPVLFDGAYSSLSGVPLTFAPIIGAGAAQACAGNDARLSDARTPTAHTQASTTISDSTAVGRAVLTAADQAAGRTAIGAGTSSFSGSYVDLTNKPTIPVVRSARVTSVRTTTATAMANVTDLAIAIGASETMSFEVSLSAGCNNTGGSQFSVTVPAGAALRVRIEGNTNTASAWTGGYITTSDAASVTLLNVSAQGRCVDISGCVVNSTNAGSIQVRFKSVTNGQTTTVDANSYMTGRVH